MERQRLVLFNKKGVTLIEMMISLVILLIVSLALIKTQTLGLATNVKNQLRDEAVNIAEMRMNNLRSLPFNDTLIHADLTATAGTTEAAIRRNFRGFFIDFTPTRTITNISTDAKQITVTVSWSYMGQASSHGVMTIMRKQ
jgi:prepilin-type N-terminal cleavage/methylation domain-containing protein